MCLLDEVTDWDATTIRCVAGSHRSLRHPLRTSHGLSSAIGVEYAAQAMAVHAALTHGESVRPHDPHGTAPDPGHGTNPAAPASHGVIASIRDTTLHVGFIDVFPEDLVITASIQSGDSGGAIYAYTIDAGPQRLIDGRAAVMFVAGQASRPESSR